jgi:hypothetical protein
MEWNTLLLILTIFLLWWLISEVRRLSRNLRDTLRASEKLYLAARVLELTKDLTRPGDQAADKIVGRLETLADAPGKKTPVFVGDKMSRIESRPPHEVPHLKPIYSKGKLVRYEVLNPPEQSS